MSATGAKAFHDLHAPGRILVLPNAWDAGSARLIENCGAEAIATTSSGVAWGQGYPDGQALSIDQLVSVIEGIVRVVQIPVSTDMEAGYSADPKQVAENTRRLIGAGAVGINLEDGRETVDVTAAKIGAVREAASGEGVDLYINARTDVYLKKLVEPEKAVAETLARAARYREAGASGIFVPLLREPDEMRDIAGAIGLPLNVMMFPGLAPVGELKALGVRRVSAGGGVAFAAFAAAKKAVEHVLAEGTYDVMYADAGSLDMNGLFAPR